VVIDAPVSPPPRIVIINPIVARDEPEINEVVLRDNTVAPEKSGFDFSRDEVVSANEKTVDVYFAVSNDGPEFVVTKDADIQDIGQDVSFQKLESVPSRNWSSTHRVHAEEQNVYIVWTWDNQYYKFKVNSLSDSRVALEWMKMDVGTRIAANDDLRNGKQHREVADMFGR
jgi:hypothetical protein